MRVKMWKTREYRSLIMNIQDPNDSKCTGETEGKYLSTKEKVKEKEWKGRRKKIGCGKEGGREEYEEAREEVAEKGQISLHPLKPCSHW